ncbi:DUF933 domain-containing protein [bacterium]|nr:DUF933 domain-containing protein [bacterium]
MKVAYTGIEVPQAKIKFNDPVFNGLAEKFQPAKLSPYYIEFLPDDYKNSQIIAITKDRVLDLLVHDMEKIENRLSRTDNSSEEKVLRKCLAHLEELDPICNLGLDPEDKVLVNALGFFSSKPTLIIQDSGITIDELCDAVLEKSGMMFFYTAGKEEVHAWLVPRSSQAQTCAGRIHSDLERGFIKAEIVNYEDLMQAHSFQDARFRGLTKLVDRDFIIPPHTVLEIRFNL